MLTGKLLEKLLITEGGLEKQPFFAFGQFPGGISAHQITDVAHFNSLIRA
jgi:hypothetical protein